MKKNYISPRFSIRCVHSREIIITSDPQISDDPSDGGQQLSKSRSGSAWDSYE